MASERQIAANRRNAQRSSGPRTKAGKKRSALNAVRHGLLSRHALKLCEEQVESLARGFADGSQDVVRFELARHAASARLDRDQVRHVKAELVARVYALGGLEAPRYFRTLEEELRLRVAHDVYESRLARGEQPPKPLTPQPLNPQPPLPEESAERIAEAFRRLRPQFRVLDRYERAAAARLDRAMRELSKRPIKR